MTGDAEFCEVFFEDVRVPADLLVGAPGAGWQIAMGILQHERGPVWTFTFQRRIRRSFEQLRALAREHPAQQGRSAIRSLRQRLAQSYIEVELLKLDRLPQPDAHPAHRASRARELAREGASAARPTSACRSWRWHPRPVRACSRRASTAASSRDYMYSRSETIMGGTSEIQRNVIAQRILGLPR